MRDAEHPLADKGRDLMLDQVVAPHVMKARRKPLRHPDRPIRRPQQQPASDVIAPPSTAATTARPSTGANPNKSALHSVGIGALRESMKVVLAQQLSLIRRSDALSSVRYPG
jgi:hypothetical protein